MVREFQSVIGREARAQCIEQEGRLPDLVVACVGGGSNAIGTFHPFHDDNGVELLGVEAGGEGLRSGRHAATLCAGRPGILHGAMSMLLQDGDGQVSPTHSVSAGLDYPGVGPELAYYASSGHARFTAATDAQALRAFHLLSRLEGIIPALESAHAVHAAVREARRRGKNKIIVVTLSGRGDKDVPAVASSRGTSVLVPGWGSSRATEPAHGVN